MKKFMINSWDGSSQFEADDGQEEKTEHKSSLLRDRDNFQGGSKISSAAINDLMTTFAKKPQNQNSNVRSKVQTQNQKSDPLGKNHDEDDDFKQANIPGIQKKPISKVNIGDKRIKEGMKSIDPMFMVTKEMNYDPTNKKKQSESEVESEETAKPPAKPAIISKEAELKVPSRAQVQLEKSFLIPVSVQVKKRNVVKKEEKSSSNSDSHQLIKNQTNVPMPNMIAPIIENKSSTTEESKLSEFLKEISKL